MLADQWRQAKQIFSEALELEPSQRPAFLTNACSGNADLRREVESLLEAYIRQESFLEHPVVADSGITLGSRLGVYQIKELIGAGGMGEVYRAVDTTLGLAVAIKVLPPLSSSDPVRLWRFEQEARAAAILHHPNILYVHQLGTHEGQTYIVSELLEGQTLRVRLKEPLSMPEIIDYANQIADGLTTAHEKGIIHRDLKPENLFITRYGQVKILDFGLAKAVEGIDRADTRPSVNRGLHCTESGIRLGTASYMSPEQIRGLETGPSSDIFSFGIVLYEMVTGTLPFRGENSSAICEAILNSAPKAPNMLNPKAPHELDSIIERALQKNPDQRYQNASEIQAELRRLKSDSASSGVVVSTQTQPKIMKWLLVGSAVALLLAVPVTWLLRQRRAPQTATGKYTLVLSDFSNSTGESIFDDALKEGLEVDLGQSTFLSLLPADKIRTELRYMGHSGDERLTPDLAREVCRRESAQAALFSSIANLGSHYVLTLKAVGCMGTELLAEEQGEADRREKVLTQLHELGSRLRNKLGESLSSIQKYDTPLEQATTSNLEALQAYSIASRTYRAQGDAASLPFYQRAIELDPNFAIAYSDLGVVYENLNEHDLSRENATKAYQLRGRGTERERFSIDSTYYRTVTGELEKAAEVYAAWKQTYPEEAAPRINLGIIDSSLGLLEKAASEDRAGLQAAPNVATIYADLACDYLSLGNLDEAERVLQESQKLKFGEPLMPAHYQLAFLGGDDKEMRRLVEEAAGKPGLEDALLASQADTEAFYGRLMQARDLSRRAVESALHAGSKESAANWQADAALREAEFGNSVQAAHDIAAALHFAKTKEVQIAAAVVLARIGEIAQAQTIAAGLTKAFPEDTLLSSYWLPTIRAAIALHQKRPGRALESLQAATPYELGGGTPPFNCGATMYPVYLRGEAYQENRKWDSAASEYQKIVDHRGLVWNFPLGVLAKFQRARVYAGLGDKPKAQAAYRELLDLWRDADTNLPPYRSAKIELARMQ
jgi:eukaryotic-like serine/threonine-protein kinase